MTDIKHQTLTVFLDELASKQATPGGGSAAALMGAQSAALTSMVCNLTIGKPKYAAVESQMQDILAQSESLRAKLLDLVTADIDVFNKLMACYGLPKNSDDEKNHRNAQIQSVLKEATTVPLECAKVCREAIALSGIATENGSLGVISDAGVAAMAGLAALKSAALNVYINAASLKDREFAQEQLAQLATVLDGADQEAEAIYQRVKDKL